MTKRLSVIALAAVALLGCTKNNYIPVYKDQLVFSAVASHSAKSIITTTNYPLDEPFVVEAVYYPDNNNPSEYKPFLSGEKVQYSFGEGLWFTQKTYFWPLSGDMVFYAGSPIIPELKVDPQHGVEVDWSAPTDGHTQTDLCFAQFTSDCAQHPAVVPIVFSHALSQVCFKARTLKHYASSQTSGNLVQADIFNVVLDSVKIHGIVSEGQFAQKPLGWTNDTTVTADYTVYANKEGLKLTCDRYDNPILNTLTTVLLIPQRILKEASLEEWHHIEVRSSITNTETGKIEQDLTYSLPRHSVLLLSNYCRQWLMDFKYTFRIAVGMENEDTEITTAVTDWMETKERIIGDE